MEAVSWMLTTRFYATEATTNTQSSAGKNRKTQYRGKVNRVLYN